MIDEPGLAEFRTELRGWIRRTVPSDWRQRLREDLRGFSVWWADAMRDAGYGPPHWAREHGGPGLSLPRQLAVYEEVALGDCPDYPGLVLCGYTHVYSTLTVHGTPEQIATHLPLILAHERVWAQAFSEPEAGSDLASLRTTAVRRGDRYVLNGQKIWSSLAPHADWAILLARTDPSAPKRRGLSFLLVDLHSPGVEVRPIKQITGADDDFAEIFFTDVEIPVTNLVGAENDGWRVAQTTLASERGPLAVPTALRLRAMLAAALPLARRAVEEAGGELATSWVGQRYAELHADIEILAELLYGTLAKFIESGEAGAESSLIKLYLGGLVEHTSEFGLQLAGEAGQHEPPQPPVRGVHLENSVEHLKSWVWKIAGGSDQIQRNIIGERVLGLPRDPLVS